ncbi:cupin domain-containing protein [Clostridium sp. LIBA-8841]|uniref:cupin domain-containing protein n=1 Tax=Clostridium sp. LIBA-8841 TaxID=2987530 RepID=UPI002AC62AC2|nr:cupin domain-containing protein [Clostridium sp. LIBA-8841]MDZ5252161.1 cupin domain-containing protein [Clostridium sp. LIBA-8841]
MYNTYRMYTCPYCADISMYDSYGMYNTYLCPYFVDTTSYNYSDDFMRFNDRYIPFTDEFEYGSRFVSPQLVNSNRVIELKDYGPQPFVVNIDEVTKQNETFRTALWTGKHLQVTLMSIDVGEDIGLEMHPDTDQFIRVEEGEGLVQTGSNKDRVDFQAKVSDDFAIMIPAGTWHNIINTGNEPLKVYSIYAPPHHPQGTIHKTKVDAEAAEKNRD